MKRLFLGIGVLVIAGGGVALSLAQGPTVEPRDLSGLVGDPDRGVYVARLGGCVACHTDAKNGGAVLAGGGHVLGVITEHLKDMAVGHPDLNELAVVPGMHERKALMADLSDGFIALPGGWGTFEELFEALTWAQLGFHAKPSQLLESVVDLKIQEALCSST